MGSGNTREDVAYRHVLRVGYNLDLQLLERGANQVERRVLGGPERAEHRSQGTVQSRREGRELFVKRG